MAITPRWAGRGGHCEDVTTSVIFLHSLTGSIPPSRWSRTGPHTTSFTQQTDKKYIIWTLDAWKTTNKENSKYLLNVVKGRKGKGYYRKLNSASVRRKKPMNCKMVCHFHVAGWIQYLLKYEGKICENNLYLHRSSDLGRPCQMVGIITFILSPTSALPNPYHFTEDKLFCPFYCDLSTQTDREGRS